MKTGTKLLTATAALGAGALAAYALSRRQGPGGTDPLVTYPPTDTLKPVADNVWIVDSGPIHPMGLSLPVRMTVIRLASGDLLLHSPTQYSPEMARQIEELGPVRHLVAPSIGHWTFLQDWEQAYPEAITWAVPGLRNRFQVRRSGVRLDRDLGPVPPGAWSDEIEQGIIEGKGFREAWFFHTPSRTLLLTDLIDNLEPEKLPAVSGMVMEAAMATSATTPAHARAAIKLGGAQAKASVRRLSGLAPERVIFAHGDWFAERGAERLRQALAWLG
ncbi:DUF4336 domain-containing protein [Altericroceibacterium xinjiangense]|uniref:DUF4336 domain-containing protein n=1 Tax=Altericroceibacterium xinjiangense TaxID=762261 RepID=UPI000F7D87C2|nr:DUF4336 domain-containing protein [Altericroceibacterium xinjiangense]